MKKQISRAAVLVSLCSSLCLAEGLGGILSYHVNANSSKTVTNTSGNVLGSSISSMTFSWTNGVNRTGTVGVAIIRDGNTIPLYTFVLTNAGIWILDYPFPQRKLETVLFTNSGPTGLVISVSREN